MVVDWTEKDLNASLQYDRAGFKMHKGLKKSGICH